MSARRILALLGAIALIGLSVALLVLAILGASREILMAVLLCLVLIPIFLYAMLLLARLVRHPDSSDEDDS